MQLVLFTTTDLRAKREADFLRMVESVRRGTDPEIRTKMFVLLQRCEKDNKRGYERMLSPGSVVLTSAHRLSLSEARNRLLESARRRTAISDDCVVGFPDDDCWYPPSFPRQLVASFGRDPRLDMLACRVCPQPVEPDSIEASFTPAKVRQVVRRSSSNSMFFRGRMVNELGDFDRSLGLGTANGSGEDTDYALRGFLAARRAVFVDLPLVGHSEPDLTVVARYFRGSFVVLSRHAFKSPDLWIECVRKIGVGTYLALRSRLSPQEYWTSMKSGLRELHRSAR
jgi:hypothetical protein